MALVVMKAMSPDSSCASVPATAPPTIALREVAAMVYLVISMEGDVPVVASFTS